MLQTVGFKIVKEEKIFYKISISDFYKNRFNLTNKEVNELIKIAGTDTHSESQIFILGKK